MNQFFFMTDPHANLMDMKLVLRNSLKDIQTMLVVLSVFLNLFLMTNSDDFGVWYFFNWNFNANINRPDTLIHSL